MGVHKWIAQRLDCACLLLHLSELACNLLLVQLWRRFSHVSPLMQLISFVIQMAVARLSVMAYLYWYSSGTMRDAPQSFRLPFLKEAMLVVQEGLMGAWLLYSVLHPFAQIITQPYETASSDKRSSVKYPVLFIHGYACNAGYWYPVLRYLSNADVTQLYTISLQPLYLDIPSFAEQVAERVEVILDATKSDKVILVGHSMGGLVARAFMKKHGDKCVAKLITLQTPHQGTEVGNSTLARAFSGDSVSDMLPGSKFLTELGSPEESNHGTIPMTSVFSYHDALVTPQESSIMVAPNTRNIPFAGIGHLVMPFVPHIQKLILHELINCT